MLLFLSHAILVARFSDLIKTGNGPVELTRILSAAAILLSSLIIIYSAACFSSLLLKNSLPAIICTPFLLLFGLLLVTPLTIFLFLVSPNVYVFSFLLLPVSIALFPVFSFLTWQRAIVKDVSSRKIIFKTTVVILLISFGSHAIANLAASRELSKALRQVKTEGIKMTPEEVIPPPIPDKDNAALIYQHAFDLAEQLKNRYKAEWEYMPYESMVKPEEMTAEQKRIIGRIMKKPEFITFYALIEQAVSMPACRFDIKYEEGPSMLLPHLAKMRSMARLIDARTYILAEEEKYNAALRSAETGLRLGDFLADEPILISQLVRIAVDAIAVKSINRLFDRPGVIFSQNDYRNLISEIEKKDRFITKSLEGELVLLGGWAFKRKTDFLELSQSSGSLAHKTFASFYGSYLIQPVSKRDYAVYIGALANLNLYSRKPYFSIKDRSAEWGNTFSVDRFQSMKHIVSSMTLPALSRLIEQQAKHNACLDSSKLGIAIKIYRTRYGKYPGVLSSIIPEILPELPLDPFTGKDYIYRREGKGFIVYSIGPNEKDNGGIFDGKHQDKYDDIVFKVTN